jgi:hypothetical protein
MAGIENARGICLFCRVLIEMTSWDYNVFTDLLLQRCLKKCYQSKNLSDSLHRLVRPGFNWLQTTQACFNDSIDKSK